MVSHFKHLKMRKRVINLHCSSLKYSVGHMLTNAIFNADKIGVNSYA